MLGHLLLAINACLPVEGERIRIRDLAAAIPAFAGKDPEESIGFAPAPGVQRRFSAGELIRLAARKGVTAPVEPVCFERVLTPLTKDQVQLALRQALPEDAEFELLAFSSAPAPAGSLDFPRIGLVRARPTAPREPVIWKGRVTYATGQSVTVWAKLRAWTSRPAVVAAEDLHAGKPIGQGQIRVTALDARPFLETTSASADEFLGKVPRRLIPAGKELSIAVLDTPPDVARGEMVGIEAHVGAASLRFQVRAEASGRIGELVRVRNPDSGKIFRARVLRKGWVAVE